MALPLIGLGARLPAEVIQSFSTTRDNQSSLEVILMLGEQTLSQENIPIGTFIFEGIAPGLHGVPEIDIRITVDEGRQLTVTATEGATRRTEVIGRADLAGLMADSLPGQGHQ
jgi:molecular chaperone DnaK (HSP70)